MSNMLEINQPLYFSSISFNNYYDDFWNNIYKESGAGGQFYINVAKRLNPCRFVTRHGEWSLPWNQELIPGFEMPEYDPTFNKTFDQVCDEKAVKIKKQIHEGKQFAVMFSGGIDSTVILVSLLKNLTKEELDSVTICLSNETIIENPLFFSKYIYGKFKTLDSNNTKYDDLIEQGLIPITADEGDCIFGTVFGLTLYNNYDYYIQDMDRNVRIRLKDIKNKITDPTVHFSNYRELIARHLSIEGDLKFGNLLYEKYAHNINTSTVPVYSLHDFFWWLIFNVKYLNCAVRGALYYNDRVDWKTAIETVVNWYSDHDYQKWSMVNNNNGQKIGLTLASYKTAAKNYIWEFDKNDWFRNFKIKLESMWTIAHQQNIQSIAIDHRPVARVGLTKDYNMIYIKDPGVKEYFAHHLKNYEIDWLPK